MKRILSILLVTGLSGAPAFADSTPLPAGCWMGAVKNAQGDSDFAVQVWSAPPGGKLHLSSPKACFLDIGDKGDGRSYSLTRPTGPSCIALLDSVLSVKEDGESFNFTIVKLGVGGTLSRNAATEEKSCHIK